MRLHGRLKQMIKNSLLNAFGTVEVFIFGSRADDLKTGGDIDLAIKTDLPSKEFNKKKIDFFTGLIRREINLKIDLVQLNDNMDSVLKEEILHEGKRLL